MASRATPLTESSNTQARDTMTTYRLICFPIFRLQIIHQSWFSKHNWHAIIFLCPIAFFHAFQSIKNLLLSFVHRPIARMRKILKSPPLVRTNWALYTPYFRPRGCNKCNNFCSTWPTTTITTTLTAATTTTTEAQYPVLILRSCSISCNNTICWINSRWVNLNFKFCPT